MVEDGEGTEHAGTGTGLVQWDVNVDDFHHSAGL